MSELSDAAVIAESWSTPESFAAIFDRHYVPIHRYLARRLSSADADDLAGEVFRIGFEKRRGFDPAHASALPWLYGITSNLVLKHHRRAARAMRVMAREHRALQVPHDVGDAERRADNRMDAMASSLLVMRELERLKSDERELMLDLERELRPPVADPTPEVVRQEREHLMNFIHSSKPRQRKRRSGVVVATVGVSLLALGGIAAAVGLIPASVTDRFSTLEQRDGEVVIDKGSAVMVASDRNETNEIQLWVAPSADNRECEFVQSSWQQSTAAHPEVAKLVVTLRDGQQFSVSVTSPEGWFAKVVAGDVTSADALGLPSNPAAGRPRSFDDSGRALAALDDWSRFQAQAIPQSG